jgi:hypothetical protein
LPFNRLRADELVVPAGQLALLRQKRQVFVPIDRHLGAQLAQRHSKTVRFQPAFEKMLFELLLQRLGGLEDPVKKGVIASFSLEVGCIPVKSYFETGIGLLNQVAQSRPV